MQPPPLRSGHLYIKYVECAESNEIRMILSLRVIGHQRDNHSDTKKNCSKVAKFTEKIGIDLKMIF